MSRDSSSVPAAGGDVDSRKRDLKHRLAAAEATGDTKTAEEVRDQLAALNREAAATARREAAKSDKAEPPASRSPGPAKNTTAGK
ncbi:MAG TPA: hypothetical protein VIQ30_19245 [Pseudonocardia sp.]